MNAEEVTQVLADAMRLRDDIAQAEVHGTEVYVVTQGGTSFRVLVMWPPPDVTELSR